MIRKTGMIISQRTFRSPMPFAGVFLCRNDVGNARLREMEPPRHDEWSPDLPEPGAGRKIFDSIGEYVRQSLKKLAPAVDQQELSIPGLERFLPDSASDNSTGLWNGDKPSKVESADHSTLVSEIRPIRVRSSPPLAPPMPSEDAVVDDDGEQIGAVAVGTEERQFGQGGERAAREGGVDKPGDHAKGQRSRPGIPLRYRSFVADEKAGRYNLAIVPEQTSDKAMLTAYAVGDDARSFIPVIAARFATGEQIDVSNGLVGPIKLAADESARIEIFLEPGARYALEVVANEAE